MAAVASFAASLVGVVGLALLLPRSSALALAIGPTEHFALVALGLSCVVYPRRTVATSRSRRDASCLALSFVGADIISVPTDSRSAGSTRRRHRRRSAHRRALRGRRSAEFDAGAGNDPRARNARSARSHDGRSACVDRSDRDRQRVGFSSASFRCCATVAAFIAYALAKRVAHRPERFGHGAIEGVAAPEAANNSDRWALSSSPTLGIAGSGTTAVLLMPAVLGIAPGALLSEQQPDLVWTLVATCWSGNAVLLLLNLPLAPSFASVLRLPTSVLFLHRDRSVGDRVYLVDRDRSMSFLSRSSADSAISCGASTCRSPRSCSPSCSVQSPSGICGPRSSSAEVIR